MCGIFGCIASTEQSVVDCEAALDLLKHRGPDASGSNYSDEPFSFRGHRRLKILDLSDFSNQPFLSQCERYEIIYNGEIFNFKELADEKLSDLYLRTTGDTEVVVELFARFGPEMLSFLNGMFAFAIWDRKERSFFIARDRFGIKPLYYFWNQEQLYFSSEIKPLLHFQKSGPVPDLGILKTYILHGRYDFCERTFFKGIQSLKPGHSLNVSLDESFRIRLMESRYYSLTQHLIDLNSANEKEIFEMVDQALCSAVRSHMISDVKVGFNISGGVDSSLLLNYASKGANGVHTFTQDFPIYSEKQWVEEVLRGHKVVPHFVEMDPANTWDLIDECMESEHEPYGGITICGYSALYKLAKEHNITVLLDGNGVDEAFLGYKKYHLTYLYSKRNTSDFEHLFKEFRSFWGDSRDQVYKLLQIKDDCDAAISIDGTSEVFAGLLGPIFDDVAVCPISNERFFDDLAKQEAFEDLTSNKIPRGLRFNDRISMSHSCELRVPFLDHRLVELGFSIPNRKLLNSYGSKAITRSVLAGKVGQSVAFAPKRSVQAPQREWIADQWRPMIEEVFGSSLFVERGWANAERLSRAYIDYCSGSRDNSFFIWQWLSLELWARKFF